MHPFFYLSMSIFLFICPLENMIYKGLDDDEAGFLNLVAYQQANRDAELLQLEREEISTFKVS